MQLFIFSKKACTKELVSLLPVKQSDKQVHWYLKGQVHEWSLFSQEVIHIRHLVKDGKK